MIYGVATVDLQGYWHSKDPLKSKILEVYRGMIRRCYSSNAQEKHPYYKGSTVCERWLIFSNFVKDLPLIRGYKDFEEWAKSKTKKRLYVLDKDIYGNGSKHYSVENCAFITLSESTREVNHRMHAQKQGQFSKESQQKRVANTDFHSLWEKSKEKKLQGLMKAGKVRAKNCSKPVTAYNDNEKKSFSSITACANHFGIRGDSIIKHIKNQTCIDGYRFEYQGSTGKR